MNRSDLTPLRCLLCFSVRGCCPARAAPKSAPELLHSAAQHGQGKQISGLGYHHTLSCALQRTARHRDLFSCLCCRATDLESELLNLPPGVHETRSQETSERTSPSRLLLSLQAFVLLCSHKSFWVSCIFNSIFASKAYFPIQLPDFRTAANYRGYGLVGVICLEEKHLEQFQVAVERYSPHIFLLAPLQAWHFLLGDKQVVSPKSSTTLKLI